MLEKLRAKPDHTKQIIALALTIIIFASIVFVWVSSWDARMREGESRAKAVSPLDGFTAMIDGFVREVRTSVSSVPSYMENATTTAPSVALGTSSARVFDMSSVVIIDTTASSSTSTLSQ